MKQAASCIVLAVAAVLLSCSEPQPAGSGSSDETGVLQLAVHMTKVGALTKTMKAAEIEITRLFVTLSADDQPSVYDTIPLTGGNYERTERKTYPELIAFVNGRFVEWTLSVKARDRMDRVIYEGDTTFTLIPLDTVQIPLHLDAALYSMLIANFYPVRDSVTRCELNVDNAMVADSSFPKQSLVGDTVTLSHDYLAADPAGVTHDIVLNAYGEIDGSEELLYQGDTTIEVRSGEDTNYNIVLTYVGPGTFHGALTMFATIGRVGKTTINGRLTTFEKYFLTVMSSNHGTAGESDSVTHGIPYTITAIPEQGWNFTEWQVIRGTATIENPWEASTTVTLRNGDATVLAIFGIATTGASGY